jgi:hypothetical protein
MGDFTQADLQAINPDWIIPLSNAPHNQRRGFRVPAPGSAKLLTYLQEVGSRLPLAAKPSIRLWPSVACWLLVCESSKLRVWRSRIPAMRRALLK